MGCKAIRWGMVIFFCFGPLTGYAKQIRADVSIILERLSIEKQGRLANLDRAIAAYLTDYDWTGEAFEEPIPVTVQIFLQDVSTNYEDRYSATFLISNGSDIQYFDKYWRFPYQAGDPLEHLEHGYHPFTGFLDFYVYLLLGSEYDKMGRLAGTPYYEKAKHICQQALFDANFQRGWKERLELVESILGEAYRPFREMKDLYFLGLSYQAEDLEKAQTLCEQAITTLEKILKKDPEHNDALNFIKAHYIEIIDLFRNRPDVLQRMIRLDPDHRGAYEQYLPR